MKLLWSQTVIEDALPNLSVKIADQFRNHEFCTWLQGSLGSGKTTLVGHILRSLGLAHNFPVSSPTFTILNEYTVGDLTYGHMDLYRLNSEEALHTLVDHRHFTGLFIEWPERIVFPDELRPTHVINISTPENMFDRRTYSFFST